jgi:hypothetical protein
VAVTDVWQLAADGPDVTPLPVMTYQSVGYRRADEVAVRRHIKLGSLWPPSQPRQFTFTSALRVER